MKKNPAFEHWIADHMMDGMIMIEPYLQGEWAWNFSTYLQDQFAIC